MKLMKRIPALLLALLLVLAMAVPALASGDTPEGTPEPSEPTTPTYTITITPNPDDPNDHTYEAYQLFVGDVAVVNGSTVLSNIEWGANVDSERLDELAAALNALRDEDTPEFEALTATSTAAEFADAIAALNATNDDETAQAIADAFAAVLTGNPAGTSEKDGDNYVIEGLAAGYYLVKDQDGSLVDANGDPLEESAYTRYILQVVGDVTVDAKSEVPSVDKDILDPDPVDENEAAIGDTVNYQVTTHVPNMTGYNSYTFIIHDTMSKGLTFNNDVEIAIDDAELVNPDDFTVETADNDDGSTSITITFVNFIQYADQAGDEIVITYSAILNEDAVLTDEGNPNTVNLEYSNDPNWDGNGDEPTSHTPDDTVKTYVTKVKLIKVDGDDPDTTLAGAQFHLEGEALNIVLTSGVRYEPEGYEADEDYEEVDEGPYYLLNDGSYTETAPTPGTEGLYADPDQTYVQVTFTDLPMNTTENVDVIVTTGEDGTINFSGLGAGTYTLTELVAPSGYNLMTPNPIHFTVTFNGTGEDAETLWSFTSDEVDFGEDEDHVITITIEDNKGSQLPSTGGIGTTIFYVVGGLMVVSAAVVLVARKRASSNN